MQKILNEENYASEMAWTVLPYLKERMKKGYMERIPGQSLYYEHYLADQPRGSIVLLHGFSEGIGKFYETVYYFLQEGFHVWMLQQREHGLSYRSTEDPYLIHIEKYEDLILDLRAFVSGIVKADSETEGYPLYLFGHSLGGGVCACYIERYPDDFSRVILNAPMLEMDSGNTPLWLAKAYTKARLAGKQDQKYMPGSHIFSGEDDFNNSCTDCRERYLYWLQEQRADIRLQMCVPSVRSAYEFLKLTKEAVSPENCAKIKARVLLFQAGRENMVKPHGQETFIRQLGDKGSLILMKESKHEIYACRTRELQEYWEKILDFLS